MLAKRLGIDLGTANSLVWLAPAQQTRLTADCLFSRISIRVCMRDCTTIIKGGLEC